MIPSKGILLEFFGFAMKARGVVDGSMPKPVFDKGRPVWLFDQEPPNFFDWQVWISFYRV